MTHSFPTRRSSYLVRIHLREKFRCARFAAHDVVLAPLDPDIEQRGDQLDLVAIAAARVLVKNGYLSHLPPPARSCRPVRPLRSEEHTSELQSLMRISYAVFCLKKNIK